MNRSFFKPQCRQSIHEITTDSSFLSPTKPKSNQNLLRFLEYGFTCIGPVSCPKPKCLICYQVFNNNHLTPEFLQAHLNLKHKEYRNKSRAFFEKQLDKLEKAQNKVRRSISMDWTVEDIPSSPVTSSTRRKSMINTATPTRKSINRQYSEEFLKFGFTCIGDETAKPKPKCLLCYEILPNSSMHESALHEHLMSKHAEYKEKPIEFFAKQLEKIEKAKIKSRRSLNNSSMMEQSYTSPKKVTHPKTRQTFRETTEQFEIVEKKFRHISTMVDLPQVEQIEKPQTPKTPRKSKTAPKTRQTFKAPTEQLEIVETKLQHVSTTVVDVPPVQQIEKPQTPKSSRKSTPGRKSMGQKYSDEFLKFGFTHIGDEAKPKPKCLLCYEVLPNSCMNEEALHDHLTSKHKEYTTKPVEFFTKQLNKFLKSQGRVGVQ